MKKAPVPRAPFPFEFEDPPAYQHQRYPYRTPQPKCRPKR
jgi:hypothetical protein